MSRFEIPIAASFAAILIAGAAAAAASGADAVKDRQTHMKALGAASKALYEQIRSGSPDKAIVKASADKIAASAPDLPKWFPAGSGKEAGVKTGALPVIWSEPSGFSAAAQRLQAQSAKLEAAADVGDMANVGPDAAGVGAACKGCHDKFRQPEK